MGVIEQGTLRIGDHLEMIQPGSAATVAPLRLQCQARENCKERAILPALQCEAGQDGQVWTLPSYCVPSCQIASRTRAYSGLIAGCLGVQLQTFGCDSPEA